MTQQDTNKRKYIPLNASESAVLQDSDTLLPRDEIYEPLAEMIIQAVKKAEAASGRPLNELREHNAISIDGARGTGKTAVLLNLKRYLKEKDVLRDIHILEPVDPTLLEDGESLFLHIIVAAVLHDKDIKLKQQEHPEKARTLNQILDKLANAMESVETQKERHGIDKVRAMYSNKHLADCVQDFFKEALQLIGKKLLVLPIDDVDTSLGRAFENLEVVRRYLTTPYVLPIVSGDRVLYNEVTWRDFHGRLTNDSAYHPQEAYKTALELAGEYQRKVLPFPRRLTMPPVSSYWQQNHIILRHGGNEVMPLRNFIAWLEIFLAGAVNGLNDSNLQLPIPSMRALTQLLNQCQELIPLLPDAVRKADTYLEAKRAWLMPSVSKEAMNAFEKEYQQQHKAKKREYGSAYAEFTKQISGEPNLEDWSKVNRQQWTNRLVSHFRYESSAGSAYLVLLARQFWQEWRDTPANQRTGSIFDTPLFQPRWHVNECYQIFKKDYDLTGWTEQLAGKLPKAWVDNVESQETILPYPLAEVGWEGSRVTPLLKSLQGVMPAEGWPEDRQQKVGFLLTLLSDRYYVEPAKRRAVLNIGRIFELVITSLLADVELFDIERILRAPAFFSAKQQAPKTALSGIDEVSLLEEGQSEFNFENSLHGYDLSQLQRLIADWRNKHHLAEFDISPWLIYKVFAKTYEILADVTYAEKDLPFLGVTLNRAGSVFYAIWSAFGSFEKGPLFGLPALVTGVSLRSASNFEKNDHFIMNIGHLAPHRRHLTDETTAAIERRQFGDKTRSITNVLADHPLRHLIEEVLTILIAPSAPPMTQYTVMTPSETTRDEDSRKFLVNLLGLNGKTKDKQKIMNAATTKTKNERDEILSKLRSEYKDASWTTWFEQICSALDKEQK